MKNTSDSKCLGCDSADVAYKIEDPDGPMDGAWCAPCYVKGLVAEGMSPEVVQSMLERMSQRTPDAYVQIDIPAENIILGPPPVCGRCGGTDQLSDCLDEKGTLNGTYCLHCRHHLVTMEHWSQTNPKAKSYIEAHREATRMLAPGTGLVKHAGDAVRQLVAAERAGA
jgi:hypothetical protein